METKSIRKRSRQCKEARKQLHNEMLKAERDMRIQWVEEGKELWSRNRVARNRFNMRKSCGEVACENRTTYIGNHQIGVAFVAHKIIRGDEPEVEEGEAAPLARGGIEEEEVNLVWRLVKSTKNKSAPGPDGICSWLLKITKDTALGAA